MAKDEKDKKAVIRAFSAGGVVYRKSKDNLEWLLIKPRGTNRWSFPKGTIDKGEKSEEAAVREVEEETGIKAKIIQKIGEEKYFFQLKNDRIFKIVIFFLMEYIKGNAKVDKKWAYEVEEVRWFNDKEALENLTFKSEKEIFQKAMSLME